MTALPVQGIRDRMMSWSVTRKKTRRKWFGPQPAPAWYLATSPDGEHHEVGVRNGKGTCLYHGTVCEAIAAVASRLMLRSVSLLPSRQEIEEPRPRGKHITISVHLTPSGRDALNPEPFAWCYWCDLGIESESDAVTTSVGALVHRECVVEANEELACTEELP